MPRAVAPLFVAAVLILIVGAIIAGVRFGDEGGPVAIQPTETSDTTEPDTTDAGDTGSETEADSPSPTPTETDTAASPSPTASETGASPSPTASETGTSGQAQPGGTESPSEGASPGETSSPSATATPSDGRTPIALDDMPDTGGGAAAAIAGFVILTGAAGLASRRR